jgi:hypothetical protein
MKIKAMKCKWHFTLFLNATKANPKVQTPLYKSLLHPILYGAPARKYAAENNMKKLNISQNTILRVTCDGKGYNQTRRFALNIEA